MLHLWYFIIDVCTLYNSIDSTLINHIDPNFLFNMTINNKVTEILAVYQHFPITLL